MSALGFGEETLQALNPALVHLAISGFGPDGPNYLLKPGYDFVIQAIGGLMSITGSRDEDGGRPTKVGVAISDVVTGLFGAVSVLAGLHRPGPDRRLRAADRRVAARIDVAVLVNQAQNAS